MLTSQTMTEEENKNQSQVERDKGNKRNGARDVVRENEMETKNKTPQQTEIKEKIEKGKLEEDLGREDVLKRRLRSRTGAMTSSKDCPSLRAGRRSSWRWGIPRITRWSSKRTSKTSKPL